VNLFLRGQWLLRIPLVHHRFNHLRNFRNHAKCLRKLLSLVWPGSSETLGRCATEIHFTLTPLYLQAALHLSSLTLCWTEVHKVLDGSPQKTPRQSTTTTYQRSRFLWWPWMSANARIHAEFVAAAFRGGLYKQSKAYPGWPPNPAPNPAMTPAQQIFLNPSQLPSASDTWAKRTGGPTR